MVERRAVQGASPRTKLLSIAKFSGPAPEGSYEAMPNAAAQ